MDFFEALYLSLIFGGRGGGVLGAGGGGVGVYSDRGSVRACFYLSFLGFQFKV